MTEINRPLYQKEIELAIGDQWRTTMLELDDNVLREELGDVLDERRLKALSDRRDALIKYVNGSSAVKNHRVLDVYFFVVSWHGRLLLARSSTTSTIFRRCRSLCRRAT